MRRALRITPRHEGTDVYQKKHPLKNKNQQNNPGRQNKKTTKPDTIMDERDSFFLLVTRGPCSISRGARGFAKPPPGARPAGKASGQRRPSIAKSVSVFLPQHPGECAPVRRTPFFFAAMSGWPVAVMDQHYIVTSSYRFVDGGSTTSFSAVDTGARRQLSTCG